MITPPRSATILVVDDDPLVRRWAVLALKAAGHRVYEANGAAKAMALFEEIEAEVGILLTDIRMPEMDGLALAEWVRRRAPDTRVIYMTGFSDRIIEPDAVVLLKPFTVETLRQAIARSASL